MSAGPRGGERCEDAASCTTRGIDLLRQDKAADAVDPLVRGCMMGSAHACYNLGHLMLEGRGIPRDVTAAAVVFDTTCGKMKHGPSCFSLASLMRRGFPRGAGGEGGEPSSESDRAGESGRQEFTRTSAPQVPKQAAVVFRAGCEAAHAPSCVALGMMLMNDENGVGHEPVEANRALDRACSLGDADGCAAYAVSLLNGLGGVLDREKGTALLRRACDGGSEEACSALAQAVASGSAPPAATGDQ